jgi:hypothetical protein
MRIHTVTMAPCQIWLTAEEANRLEQGLRSLLKADRCDVTVAEEEIVERLQENLMEWVRARGNHQ